MPGGVHATEIVIAVGSSDQSADFGVIAVKGGETLEPVDDGSHGLVDHGDENVSFDLTAVFVSIIGVLLLVPGDELIAQDRFEDGGHFGAGLDQAARCCDHRRSQGTGHSDHGQEFGHVGRQTEGNGAFGVQFAVDVVEIELEVSDAEQARVLMDVEHVGVESGEVQHEFGKVDQRHLQGEHFAEGPVGRRRWEGDVGPLAQHRPRYHDLLHVFVDVA